MAETITGVSLSGVTVTTSVSSTKSEPESVARITIVALPLAWAVSLTAMTLAATLVGLVGVFGPAQPVRMAHDSRQVALEVMAS